MMQLFTAIKDPAALRTLKIINQKLCFQSYPNKVTDDQNDQSQQNLEESKTNGFDYFVSNGLVRFQQVHTYKIMD